MQALTTPLARLPEIARNDRRATVFSGRSCPPKLCFENSGNPVFPAPNRRSLHARDALDFPAPLLRLAPTRENDAVSNKPLPVVGTSLLFTGATTESAKYCSTRSKKDVFVTAQGWAKAWDSYKGQSKRCCSERALREAETEEKLRAIVARKVPRASTRCWEKCNGVQDLPRPPKCGR